MCGQVETSDVMVGVEDMFAMSLSDVIGKEQREELVSLGFSRYHFFRHHRMRIRSSCSV